MEEAGAKKRRSHPVQRRALGRAMVNLILLLAAPLRECAGAN
jgi:hypothetical protein